MGHELGDLSIILLSEEVTSGNTGKSQYDWSIIVIHFNKCIILFRIVYFMSWTHN